jgi:hypothetical protein
MENSRWTSIETRNMDRPDETRTPEKTDVRVVHLGDATIARLSVEPGWTWASCNKPLVALEFGSKTAATYAKG